MDATGHVVVSADNTDAERPLCVMDVNLLIILAAIVATAVAVFALSRRRSGGSLTAQRLIDQQTELAGRISQMTEQQALAQNQLNERLQAQERALAKALDDRLGDVSRRIGESLQKQTTQTTNTMGDLKARLAVITAAQDNITKLSAQVVSLQDVLANKQARGAFGETQLADQIRSALPPSAYQFQAKLTNGKLADCLLKLPNPPGSIAVDAKFPLESYHLLRAAKDDGARATARRSFGADVSKHVRDIAEKYIVPGETAESALMFLPSEAVYAELHAELPEVVEKSHRARVYIVSPTTLMATLNTIRAVLKDAQMREQAGLIQREVQIMADDVARLDERAANLQRHFGQAEDDLRQILISSGKVTRRVQRIGEVDLSDEDALQAIEPPQAEGEQQAD